MSGDWRKQEYQIFIVSWRLWDCPVTTELVGRVFKSSRDEIFLAVEEHEQLQCCNADDLVTVRTRQPVTLPSTTNNRDRQITARSQFLASLSSQISDWPENQILKLTTQILILRRLLQVKGSTVHTDLRTVLFNIDVLNISGKFLGIYARIIRYVSLSQAREFSDVKTCGGEGSQEPGGIIINVIDQVCSVVARWLLFVPCRHHRTGSHN